MIDRFIKARYKIKEKGGILFSLQEELCVVLENNCNTQSEEYIQQQKVENLLVIDPENLSFLERIGSIKNLVILFSYMGNRKKSLEIDFSPLYKMNIVNFSLLSSPKIVFNKLLDIGKLNALKKLTVCACHIIKLEQNNEIESLDIDYSNEKINVNIINSLQKLRYLILRNGSIDSFKDLTDNTKLESLTLRNVCISSVCGLRKFSGLKSLFVYSFIENDIGFELGHMPNLEYINLHYNGIMRNVHWVKELKTLKTLMIECKIQDGDLSCLDIIPYVKIGNEQTYYNRSNTQLNKILTGESVAGVPTYKSF